MPVPDLPEVLRQLEQGDATEVLLTLEQLADRLPTAVTAHVLLAYGYEATRQWREALEAWQWANFLMPNSPAIQEGLRHAARALHAAPGTVLPRALPVLAGPLPQPSSNAPLAPAPSAPRPDLPDEQEDGVESSTASARDIDDLDRLIGELESARIVPQPDFEAVPPPDLDDEIEDVVSETLARIYAAQQQYDEAARVYELLAAQQPEQAAEHLKKASEMRARAKDE